ncbi:dnaJ homolog subfamily C member 13-like, partial [Hyalella azteca]|uniref:DnaJ homolog subfamily C member 13-like n=1 Tax=Hyalella azteca TaxID=294128 RepID=A0A979FN43_HYAAZ
MAGPAPDIGCYLVVKHSTWKGKYKRILGIGQEGITTYNHNTLEVTNTWLYRDIVGISPVLAKTTNNQGALEFQLSMYKKNKVDHMRFSSDHRADILTKALGHRHAFAQPLADDLRSAAQKARGRDGDCGVAVALVATPRGIEQLNGATGALIACYHYCNIEALLPVSDLPGGLAIKVSVGPLLPGGLAVKVSVGPLLPPRYQGERGALTAGDLAAMGPLLRLLSLPGLQRSAAQKARGRDGDCGVAVALVATPRGIEQLNGATGALIACYHYCNIEALLPVSDLPGGLAIKTAWGRLHVFSCARRDELLTKAEDNCRRYIGLSLSIAKQCVSLTHVLACRMGSFSDDIHQTSLCEFPVQKVVSVARHPHSTVLALYDPPMGGPSPNPNGMGANYMTAVGDGATTIRRILALSESCLVERDPTSYGLVTLRPLSDIHALVRCQHNPQRLEIEWVSGGSRVYTCSDRDALLASLMDGARGSGHLGVHVRMSPSDPCKRLGPAGVPVTEEVESMCLRLLQQPVIGCPFSEAVERFNANVPYSGLLHSVSVDGFFAENKERLITGALGVIVMRGDDNPYSPNSTTTTPELQAQFHALRRLVASKAGFAALTSLPGFREKVGLKVMRGLQRGDAGVTHAALDLLCALLQPMHSNPDLKQEQLNKTSLLHSQKFQEKLMENFVLHVNLGTGGLVIAAMLDFLTFAVVAPYSETTDGAHFDFLLKLLARHGRQLYKLFQHPSLAVVKGAGLVLKAVIEEGDDDIPEMMQRLSLTEGALPSHLYTALYTRLTDDGRLLGQRQLSRHLVGLWTANNEAAMELLGRILPRGLLAALESTETVPVDDIDRLSPRDNLAIAAAAEAAAAKQGSAVVRAVGDAVKTTAKKVERLVERHMDKLEGVERSLQPATKQIEKYYEQYLEKHLDKDLLAVQHWKQRLRREKTVEERFRERPIVLRKRREHLKPTANWPLFYYNFQRDHALPNLIWNHGTREELRVALEKELREFAEGRDLPGEGAVSWNYQEFEVEYASLNEEIRIGDYYLRILLEQDSAMQAQDSPIRKSSEFFNDLYHRFLLTPAVPMKCLCLQAMALVYGLHHDDIGPFNDTKYIVTMLARCQHCQERDRLLVFLSKLILHRGNVREVLEGGGVRVLTDLMSLAHLHTQRAHLPTSSNCIEAGTTSTLHLKEWYYQDAAKTRAGPYSFPELKELYADGAITAKTLVWAQGLEGWKPLLQVPQLKWTLLATGTPVLTESALASLCLSLLTGMCSYFPPRTPDGCVVRPLARVRRYTSDPLCLPTLTQLLLTFDPDIVEKVATLLCEVLTDNPALSTVYTTGLFFFVLMYVGSNVLPVARLLHLCHLRQTFRPQEQLAGGDLLQQSILGPLLPEAMVCYLHNYGPDKFAEIFLGEFDTPEVIWNREMRRYMIEKIACHLGDFTPRLVSNTRAQYQYCPIPHITFPQLESELFCDIYYLKHLCDTSTFPNLMNKTVKPKLGRKNLALRLHLAFNQGLKDPVMLLKKVLSAWREEVHKQPPSMSADAAYEELELTPGQRHADDVVRRAYLRLAARYHPDKNAGGRVRCWVRCWGQVVSGGVLYTRYSSVLSAYKYAGYPMLLKTVVLEGEDDDLFSKPDPLLGAAAELCHRTIQCCALNATELCRERGLQIVQEAYSRCVGVLSTKQHTSTLAVQVCTHTARCFTAAAAFPTCRGVIAELPTFPVHLCHTLYYQEHLGLSLAGVECCGGLAVDPILQLRLLHAGVLWHLLQRLFLYDYTLEEGGVQRGEESNAQEVVNKISVAALRACGRLAGLYPQPDPSPTPATPGEPETSPEDVAPYNPVIAGALRAMLTPYVVGLIPIKQPQEAHTEPSRAVSGVCGGGGRVDGKMKDVAQALQALHNVCSANPGVELQCVGHFRLLLSLLRLEASAVSSLQDTVSVQRAVLRLLTVVATSADCVADIASSQVVVYLLLALHSRQLLQERLLTLSVVVYLLLALHSRQLLQERLLTLSILQALVSSTSVVKELLSKGGVLYLLAVFCCEDTTPDVREKAGALLGSLCCDRLLGQRVRLLLLHQLRLPACLVDQLRDSPATALHVLQTTHETPDLVWTDESRARLRAYVHTTLDKLYADQRRDPATDHVVPESAFTCPPAAGGEEEGG